MTMALLGSVLQQASMPVRVADGLPGWWWHFGAAVATGAHHVLHSTLAFGPAASANTIDRTVARDTGRS